MMVSLQAQFQRALGLHQQGQLEAAAAIYLELLRVDGANPEVLHMLGVVALQRGDSQRAVDLIGQEIRRRPDEPGAQANLGAALLALNRKEEAKR